MSRSPKPIRLRQHLLNRFGVREWGLPAGMYVGKGWRSEVNQTVSLILPAAEGRCRIDTRPVIVVSTAAEEFVPTAWQTAARRYCLQWPDSADAVAAFADLTRAERHAQIATIVESQMAWMKKHEDDVRELPDFLRVLAQRLAPWGGDYQNPEWLEERPATAGEE